MPQNIDTTSGQPIQPVTIVQSGASGGDVSVSIDTSNAAVPIDLQSHFQTTIQTHNAVSVAASTGTSISSWIDTDGFTDVGITLMNDATASCYVDVRWSFDGTTYHGAEASVIAGSLAKKSISLPTKARYIQLVVANTDTIAHTMSAWVYLKA